MSTHDDVLTAGRVAELAGGVVAGDAAARITGVAGVEEARAGDLVFAESPRYVQAALKSRASVALTPPDTEPTPGKTLVLVADPRLAFVRVLEFLAPAQAFAPGVHSTATVADGATLGAGVSVGPRATVEAGARLGDRAVVMAGAHVGANCLVGADTVIHPNAVLYPGVTVGQRCVLHAGCVIGADGFGYIPVGSGLRKVPQLGTVGIGDDVEIGANTCIDRAKTGATVIGPGTKIDNLVHIAHNVRVGRSCIIVAQVGVAGGVEIGDGVILAGQAGLKDHVKVGDGARVAAQAGLIGDVPPGATYSGYPARPHAEKMRELAASASLPDYVKRIRALEKRLAELERAAEQEF